MHFFPLTVKPAGSQGVLAYKCSFMSIIIDIYFMSIILDIWNYSKQ